MRGAMTAISQRGTDGEFADSNYISDDEGALPVVEPSASGYQKENPTCVFVAPNSTSAQITNTPPNGNSASKAKHIDPGHYVCTPASGEAPRGLLVLALPSAQPRALADQPPPATK